MRANVDPLVEKARYIRMSTSLEEWAKEKAKLTAQAVKECSRELDADGMD